jgi:hypothetical protein
MRTPVWTRSTTRRLDFDLGMGMGMGMKAFDINIGTNVP